MSHALPGSDQPADTAPDDADRRVRELQDRVNELEALVVHLGAELREARGVGAPPALAIEEPAPEESEPGAPAPVFEAEEEAPESETESEPAPRRPGWTQAAHDELNRGLRQAVSSRGVFGEAVRLIGTGGRWDSVVAWVLDPHVSVWACQAAWTTPQRDLSRLENAMWQARLHPDASAVGAAATAKDSVWVTDPGADGDWHMAALRAEEMYTVVFLPVHYGDATLGVLELGSAAYVRESPAAVDALRAVARSLANAHRRVTQHPPVAPWERQPG
ncbi:MAG: GAF domain-containing protein [Solirubrobacterales bacterium]|nr:GAF domain-containing protein [Solirubrobacterales bacterium]